MGTCYRHALQLHHYFEILDMKCLIVLTIHSRYHKKFQRYICQKTEKEELLDSFNVISSVIHFSMVIK